MKPIIAVTGLGRSGTSLMMRMLHAGGIAVHADESVTYEFANCADLAFVPELCPGKAVKLMDPLRWNPPRGPQYLFIWMHRSYIEQARSHAKLQRKLHQLPVNRTHVKYYEKQFKSETIQSKGLLGTYAGSSILTVDFEKLLKNPLEESRRVMYFLQPHFQPAPSQMAAQVVKRDAACLPDFLEDRYMTHLPIKPQ